MKMAHLPTHDLVHQAKHAMTPEMAIWAVREFLKRPDATLDMYYHIATSGRTDAVKIIAEEGMLKRSDAKGCTLAWIAEHGHSDEVALKSLWQLSNESSAQRADWSRIAHDGRTAIVRLRAQEVLVAHPDATTDDLLWLDECGMTEEIKSTARLKLNTLI